MDKVTAGVTSARIAAPPDSRQLGEETKAMPTNPAFGGRHVRLHSRPTSRGRSRIRSFTLGLGGSPSALGACAHRPETLAPSNLKRQKAKRNAVIHSRIRSRRSDADTRRMGARPAVAHKSRETRATNLGRLTPAMEPTPPLLVAAE
jgi:hypothetical protein